MQLREGTVTELKTGNPAVSTNELSKRYAEGTLALDGLTLTVEPGEIFGFLGPNGAGKSTTIRLLMDLIRPTGGSASVFGLDCQKDAQAVHRLVGYLPGELSLYKGRSAQQHIDLVSDLRPGQVDTRYVAEACERLRLDLDTPVGHLSHGNRQKVGLVLALMAKPRLVILDEPTSGLDPLAQRETLEILREARNEGQAVFFSSHYLPEVERICDRVAIVRQGRLVAVESVEKLTTRTMHSLRVELNGTVDETALMAVDGVRSVEVTNGGTVATIEAWGEMDALVKALATFHVVSLEAERPSLEDAFLEIYSAESDEETDNG
jgi:ABC-2 type transport system ATP-binding protein